MNKKLMINPGWKRYERLTFAPAVRKGNMLFITGQDGAQIDPATGKPKVSGGILHERDNR